MNAFMNDYRTKIHKFKDYLIQQSKYFFLNMIFKNPELICSYSNDAYKFNESKANHFSFCSFMIFKEIIFSISCILVHMDKLFC